MATKYWTGAGVAVQQVATTTFATYDVTTTRKITIGGVVVSAADSGGTLTTALTALAVLLNNSLHPYFSAITWTSSATQIIGTADTAGCPFTFAGSVTGGTGTCSDAYTITTANAGPNDWTTVANWSDGVLPADTDTVIFKDSAVNVAWGFAQSGIQPTLLRFDQTYTGLVGLSREFATGADGGSTTTAAQEYRDQYLAIGPTKLHIGKNFSYSTADGSGRIKIDLGTDACTVDVFGTAATPNDDGTTAVQIKANQASTNVYVRSAPGGVGIAIGPAETSVVGIVSISDTSTASKVITGPGVTLTTWYQSGGVNSIWPPATVTTVTVNGGTLTIEGTNVITTLNCNDGTTYSNVIGTIGTANLNGLNAVLDFQGSNQPRTVTTMNITKGTLKADGSFMTFTTINDPASEYTVTAA